MKAHWQSWYALPAGLPQLKILTYIMNASGKIGFSRFFCPPKSPSEFFSLVSRSWERMTVQFGPKLKTQGQTGNVEVSHHCRVTLIAVSGETWLSRVFRTQQDKRFCKLQTEWKISGNVWCFHCKCAENVTHAATDSCERYENACERDVEIVDAWVHLNCTEIMWIEQHPRNLLWNKIRFTYTSFSFNSCLFLFPSIESRDSFLV